MAVSANQLITAYGAGRIDACPIAASKTIYQGTLVFAASGYATDVIASGANLFLGIAIKAFDNSAGSAGDLCCEYYTLGSFLLTFSSIAITNIRAKIYASDNYTPTTSSSSTSLIGSLSRYVSSTTAYVDIDTQPA